MTVLSAVSKTDVYMTPKLTWDGVPELSEQAHQILNHRYLLKNIEHEVSERPSELFKRVAKTIAEVDKTYGHLPVEVELLASEFYGMMSTTKFLPNAFTVPKITSRSYA